MPQVLILLAQAAATAMPAAWLTLGLRDNIRHPDMNGAFVAEVMSMTRMRRDFPDAFHEVAGRAITNERIHKLAMRLVVVIEFAAVTLLWLGAAFLAASAFGLTTPQLARGMSLVGALAFTAIWAGFLIVGNHFCYWYCHEGAQTTHYHMTLWGLGIMIFLVVG